MKSPDQFSSSDPRVKVWMHYPKFRLVEVAQNIGLVTNGQTKLTLSIQIAKYHSEMFKRQWMDIINS